jgi:hypothetical protein
MMWWHCMQAAKNVESEYDLKVVKAQERKRYWPVVYNKGRTMSVKPLSKLNMVLGFEDVAPEDEADATVQVQPALA